jgi:hypothetical protein
LSLISRVVWWGLDGRDGKDGTKASSVSGGREGGGKVRRSGRVHSYPARP